MTRRTGMTSKREVNIMFGFWGVILFGWLIVIYVAVYTWMPSSSTWWVVPCVGTVWAIAWLSVWWRQWKKATSIPPPQEEEDTAPLQ